MIFNIYQITDFLSTVVFLTPSRMTSLEYEKIKNYKKNSMAIWFFNLYDFFI